MSFDQPVHPKPESATPSSSTLPLLGEKKRLQVVGSLLLFLFVIIVNFLVMHQSSKKAALPDEETYNTSSSTPLSSAKAQGEPSHPSPMTKNSKDSLDEKMALAKAQDFISRLQASQNVSPNLTASSSLPSSTEASQAPAVLTAQAANTNQDPNTAFLLQASNSKAQHEFATHFGPQPFVIGQGKFIFGTLSVAINSDLPGQIEAVVSQDVYGEQGTNILIPQGSRLIGEYKSGLSNNQSRLFTVWTRIIEPNGVDIELGSEGTDALGRAGLTGNVDYHFFDRFGSALLISMIGAGTATIGVNPSDSYNSASVYRSSVAGALSDQGKNMLAQNINIPPTIKVKQGEKIVVFVNRDLDFSRVYR